MSLPVRCLVLFVVSSVCTIGGPVRAQQKPAPAVPEKTIAIRAGHLIDGKSDKALDNVLIVIKGDTIVSVGPTARRQRESKSLTSPRPRFSPGSLIPTLMSC